MSCSKFFHGDLRYLQHGRIFGKKPLDFSKSLVQISAGRNRGMFYVRMSLAGDVAFFVTVTGVQDKGPEHMITLTQGAQTQGGLIAWPVCTMYMGDEEVRVVATMDDERIQRLFAAMSLFNVPTNPIWLRKHVYCICKLSHSDVEQVESMIHAACADMEADIAQIINAGCADPSCSPPTASSRATIRMLLGNMNTLRQEQSSLLQTNERWMGQDTYPQQSRTVAMILSFHHSIFIPFSLADVIYNYFAVIASVMHTAANNTQ